MDDNIIENLAIKISANFAAADGVVYLSDTRCSSLRTSQFYFLNILADWIFFSRDQTMTTITQDLRPPLCSLFLKPEVERCHSVFNQSAQFIFAHFLTSDKLEPF